MDLSFNNKRSEEDEDEDFISPISPLYKYFEQEEFDQAQENHQESSKQSILNSILNGLGCLRGTFVDICDVAVSVVYRTLCSCHNKVQIQTFNKVFNIVCEKRLLIPEDIVFIESFVPDTLYVVEDHFFRWTVPIMSSCVLFGYFIIGGGDIETELISNIYFDNLALNIGKKLALFTVSFTFSFSGWYFLLYCYHRFKCYCIQSKMTELCANLNTVVSTFKKSFRVVQESEMIARGFTSASAASVAQRLELSTTLPINSADRQLPEYRKLLFSWIKDIFIIHRNATLELIESYPISTDCMSHYFATLELKEFGNLLKYDVHSAEELVELLKVSDNLSISSLKSLHQLMEVQISEFLRRYCLSLLTNADPEDVNYFAAFEKLTGICDLLKKILDHHSKILAIAKQAYSYNRSVQESSHSSGQQFKPSTASPLHNFAMSLHDLNLHLRATLVKTIAIEDYVNQEENMSPDETPAEVNDQVTKLSELLNDVKAELSVSNECVLECYNFIEHLERKSAMSQHKSDEIPNWQLIEKAFSECNQKLNFIGDSDPVIEDEVYEAITRETGVKDNSKITERDYDEKHKVDKITTAHLMRELKTILVVKAEEHREREQKALEAKALKEKKLGANSPGLEDKCQDNDLSKNNAGITDTNIEIKPFNEDELKAMSNYGDEAQAESKASSSCGELKTEPDHEVDNDIDNSSTLPSEIHYNDFKEKHIFCDIFQQKTLNFHDADVVDPSSENSDNLPFKNDISGKSEFSEKSSIPTNLGLSSLFQSAQHSSFTASIASLAAERQRKLNLQNLTYECDEDIIEDDC